MKLVQTKQQLQTAIIIGTCFALGALLLLVRGCAYADEDMEHKAVIHHTASHDVSAEVIDQWHKERGWEEIGYHIVIRADGKVELGRDFGKTGAHAKGRNHWLGIALTGHNKFTKAQIKSLIKFLKSNKIDYIEAHHEECPGKGLDLDYIRREILK